VSERRRRIISVKRVAALLAIGLLALGVLVGVGWYRSGLLDKQVEDAIAYLEQTDPAELDAAARHVEDELVRQWSAPVDERWDGPDSPPAHLRAHAAPRERTVRVEVHELNAWLDRKLEEFLINQEVPGGQKIAEKVERAVIVAEGNRLRLAVKVKGKDRVLVGDFVPVLADDGRLSVELASFHVGVQWVPRDNAIRSVAAFISDREAREKFVELSGWVTRPIPFDPAFDDEDRGRTVRLTAFHITEQEVELTFRIDPLGAAEGDRGGPPA